VPTVLPLAATWVDGAVLASIAAFAVWGVLGGAFRQAAGFAILVAGLVVASIFGPRLEPAAAKALGPGSEEGAACLAWGCALVGTLVVGALVLRALRRVTDRLPRVWALDRATGGAVGAVKGVLVAAIAAYAVLGAVSVESRRAPVLRESVGVRVLRGLEGRLRPWMGLPAGVQGRVDAVNASLAPGTPP
jgi:uncharacterized membrane protein required for colicin V production